MFKFQYFQFFSIQVFTITFNSLVCREAARGVTSKKNFLKILQYLQENTSVGVSKRLQRQVFPCEICKIFKKTYSEEPLQMAGSVFINSENFDNILLSKMIKIWPSFGSTFTR